MVKTRFAPSPTGFLHIGGARTCLFSWLYARSRKGSFVLRIEDTDRVRSKKEYLEEILESLKWLGLDWDEIYYQSRRFKLYREHAQKLIDAGKAYEKEGAVFFKYEFDEVEIDDLIKRKMVFRELPKDEEVIIKSDGSPTYNFSCVIDDALMQITHVIRGDDHISNTPKQILMYKALGFDLPFFAHVPLILAEQGGRLSKRFGATSIRQYKELGYLPQAVVNYLLLLGWSPGGDQEIISLSQAKDKFDLRDINKAAASFTFDKFNWLNAHYIKESALEDLYWPVVDVFARQGLDLISFDKEYVLKVMGLFRERTTVLSELPEKTRCFFNDDFTYASDTDKVLEKKSMQELKKLTDSLTNLNNFDKETIEKEFRAVCDSLGLKARDLVHPARVALSGQTKGPGLFEAMEV
ncbi:MAG: glutamate--tRNA ligase, partial [Candidatus Omnitrophica bacterium]|nr:glutamate--tRNA ligase [Candidatus Omnitrophota bacterium]